MQRSAQKHHEGYLLIEIMVATVVLGMLLAFFLPTLGFLLKRSSKTPQDVRANLILQEGIEISYNVLLANWDAYPDDTYSPSVNFTSSFPTWTLTSSSSDEVEAKYTRTITISSVYRDTVTGEISDSGVSQLDPHAKMIESTVTWVNNGKSQSQSAKLLVVKF